MDILTEILKYMGSSALTAIILGYFFNKKLERYKSISKASEGYLSSVVEGINRFIGSFRVVIEKSKQIEIQLKTGYFEKKSMIEFIDLPGSYASTINQHRIYLLPFLPFGISNEYTGVQEITALSLYTLSP